MKNFCKGASIEALHVPPTGAVVIFEITRQFGDPNDFSDLESDGDDGDAGGGGGGSGGGDDEEEERPKIAVQSLGAAVIDGQCSALAMAVPAPDDAASRPPDQTASTHDHVLVATFDNVLYVLQWELLTRAAQDEISTAENERLAYREGPSGSAIVARLAVSTCEYAPQGRAFIACLLYTSDAADE